MAFFWTLFTSLFLSSAFASANEKTLIQFLEVTQLLQNLEPSQILCSTPVDSECPPVHVTAWCQKQFDLLKKEKPEATPPFQSKPQTKSVLFLGEEHGDEDFYSYYEKLLSDKNAGFDCLFLELPSVFQKNFEHKKGIVHDQGVFKRLDKSTNPNELNSIELLDHQYIGLLESLTKVAKQNKVKVILVDSSQKMGNDLSEKTVLERRNREMAKNIQNAFSKKQCTNGLSIQGNAHLFTKDTNSNLYPVDHYLKEENAKAPSEKIEIKKAFLYSAGNKNLKEAMGPCSWLNLLPESQEAYYSGSHFSKQSLLPENLEKAFSEKYGELDSTVDYAIFLPQQIDKNYLLKKLNEQKEIPKKPSTKHEVSIEAHNVDMELRTNSWSLNISGAQNGLIGLCSKKCEGYRYEMLIKDISYSKPTISCQHFHPSYTGGATMAPVMKLNPHITADCYCTSKY